MKSLLKIVLGFFIPAIVMMLLIFWTCKIFHFDTHPGAVFTGIIFAGVFGVALTMTIDEDF